MKRKAAQLADEGEKILDSIRQIQVQLEERGRPLRT